ncbi:hypothetical protein [Virgibacillus sp. CBA3643]|uniref:hypothetical protein n=1 Tax=Virgibacillus sp. CBA3643 TaxID=2942278 RepID=UPI0035A28F80
MMEYKYELSYEILSDVNGITTVAFLFNDRVTNIMAYDSYKMLHALDAIYESED